ncbi:MAG: pyridoxal phosphate-dependent aminotransferase [Aigarchaeota archaeon]|nr:pyridoxal phosphate-dependent aminotransferase [Aigarchaeota archaeon]
MLERLLKLCSEAISHGELLRPETLTKALEECRRLNLSEDFARRLLGLLIEEYSRIHKLEEREEDGLRLRAFATKVREMQLSGIPVMRLELGEPDFSAPPSAVEAAYRAMREGYSKYGPAIGIAELRRAIAEKLSEKFGADLKVENVAVTAGGTFATYGSIEALSKPGDEVVVIEPAWPLYAHQAKRLGRRVLKIRTHFDDDWDPVDALQEKVSKLTKIIIINYPNNPTGKVLDLRALKAISQIAEDVGAWVVSDEVYMDFSYGGGAASILQLSAQKTLMLNSFSKTWGMTGFRVGYVISEPSVVEKVAAVQNTAMTCIPEFVQRAALAALNDEEAAKRNIELIGRRLRILYEELTRSDLMDVRPPRGSMYIFPRIKLENFDSWKFAKMLLEELRVAVAPGACFGSHYNNHLRISAVLDDEPLREACRRIREALEKYG